MRFSSLRYLIKEGFRSLWQNRFMAIASIGVLVSCLLLTGGAYLVFVNIDSAFDWVYGQNVVVAFARGDCTEEETAALMDKLKGLSNVTDVTFVSKEESLEKYKDSIPAATYQDMQGENNPMPDSYVVTFGDLTEFDATLAQIQQIPEVEDVSYNADIAATLTRVRHIILVVGGWIILMLLLVSLFIIANTIKLTVYNRRLEISIMKSVGATNAFVRIPFVVEGMVLGLIAGGLAYGILYFLYTKLSEMFHFGSMMQGLVSFSSVWWIVLVGFLGIGVLTGMAGSAISIRKYMKEEGGLSGVL